MKVTKSGYRDVSNLIAKWRKDPEFERAYRDLGEEFEIAAALISARSMAGLTQEALAKRMSTTQSTIARLESGRARPSSATLQKIASATGTRLVIGFEPLKKAPPKRRKTKSA